MVNLYYWLFLVLMLFSFIMMIMSGYFLVSGTSFLLDWSLFKLNSVSFSYVIYLDWISSGFTFVVFFICSLVILYSSEYMGKYNYNSVRFIFLILLFVLSMLLMVISPNLLSIMLGWDGLGLVSYCLVIYYMSMVSYISGMITCLVNRMGDVGLLVSIGWIFNYGSWNFLFYSDYLSLIIFYLVIVSSFTKSAQIPFSMWLPAAMAAPTPVSALVHSSTLVTAGVYLLIRFFNYMYMYNMLFLLISLMTMIMASFSALFEYDLKKIIALSTLSQLGLMMSSLFSGMVDLTFFHLISHAMFKSLLFLCAGIIIHMMNGCQDIRYMGSFCLSMPLTSCCLNISNLALCGFPFLSGFYSKDMIFDFVSFNGMNFYYLTVYYFSICLTLLYSFRLFFYSMILDFNSYCPIFYFKDSMNFMKISIFTLSLFSLIFGCLFMWLSDLSLMYLILPFSLKILSLLILLMSMVFVIILSFFSKIKISNMFFSHLNGSMWFMYGYSYYLFYYNYNLSNLLSLNVYWGEYYGGLGLSYYLLKVSNYIQFYLLSSYKIFMLLMLMWILLLL